MSTREELRSKFSAPKTGEVDLGDGVKVRIRAVSKKEWSSLKDKGDSYAFAACVVNENGSRMYDPNDPADIEEIENLPIGVVLKVATEFLYLCGIRDRETAAKN